MDPFFGNRSWYPYQHPDPRYAFSHSPSYRGVPVHRVDPWETRLPAQRPAEGSPAQKVVRIPVRYVGSKKVDRSASALKIQKVFRGFLVRKYLRKIKEIKVKVDAVEERLSDGGVVELIRKDEKERLRTNETLMSLLLQLDSICGLDFGVRQCRKAVIRKAIALQEKIDAIVASSSNENVDNCATADQGTDIPVATVVEDSNQPVESEKPNDSLENPENPDNNNRESDEIINVGVDREVKVVEESCVEHRDHLNQNHDLTADTEEDTKKALNILGSNSGADYNKSNRELLERMMEENEKMMNMMTQLFEKNEAQTRMLNTLTQRVEALEKAFACERLRKKKKKNNAPPRRED